MSASRCALAGVDGGVDRHARAQQVLLRHVLRHADADRQPLHDLGEIAGGVVRRQQREHRARRGRNAVDDASELAMAVGVDRDRHGLAGTDALELGLLEIGVDEDLVERHHIAEPLAGLDEVAGIDEAVGEGAVDRRAHRGEVEIALGLGERGLQFRQLGAGLVLLRLGHLDIVARGVIGRLRRFHGSDALVAAGFGNFEGGARGKALGAQRLLAVEIEAGALQRGFRGGELRLGLLDRAFQRGDLAADAVDGGLLGRDPGARRIDRDPVVAVVDPEDHVAGAERSSCRREGSRRHGRRPARRAWCCWRAHRRRRSRRRSGRRRRNRRRSWRQRAPAIATMPISTNLRLPDFGAADCRGIGRWRGRLVGRRRARRVGRPAPGFFRDVSPKLLRQLGGASRAASPSAVSGSVRMTRAAWSLAAAITGLLITMSRRSAQPKPAHADTVIFEISIDRTVRSRYIMRDRTIGRKSLPARMSRFEIFPEKLNQWLQSRRTAIHVVGDEDSSKRRQILDGARKVFMDLGFDGASMGEIARVRRRLQRHALCLLRRQEPAVRSHRRGGSARTGQGGVQFRSRARCRDHAAGIRPGLYRVAVPARRRLGDPHRDGDRRADARGRPPLL